MQRAIAVLFSVRALPQALPLAFEVAEVKPNKSGAVRLGVSAVDRSVKKFTQLAPLVRTAALVGILGSAQKTISGDHADLAFATLAELAYGLPRSLPFHSARVRFSGAGFGVCPPLVVAGIAGRRLWRIWRHSASIWIDRLFLRSMRSPDRLQTGSMRLIERARHNEA